MLADLDALEVELREAIAAAQVALEDLDIGDAA